MVTLPPPPAGYADRIPPISEAHVLVCVGQDHLGRDALLAPSTATAWYRMNDAALADGISLIVISAFRSAARQSEIIAGKLAKGMSLEQALEYSAYPGFSEHHSGRALDLGCAEAPHLDESFETTEAFGWLVRNAGRHGFLMSYPRNHRSGIAYEPWHWCHHAPPA